MENTETIFRIAENGQEEKRHGSIDFPCALYRNDTSVYVPWHWHDEYEISYVKKGRLHFYAGEEVFELEEGEGLFVNSQIMHHNHAARGSECAHEEFVFSGRLIFGSEESILWKKYIQPVTLSSSLCAIRLGRDQEWQENALKLIEEAAACYREKSEGYEFKVRECLTGVFMLIYKNCREKWEREVHTSQDEADRMKLMLRFIDEHFDEQIKLAQIAESANICERECIRSFQKLVRCSPVQYLIRYRIHKACSMLVENKYSITRICSDCGFASPSYFAKIFKRETGCTPKEFARDRHLYKQENILL